MEYIVKLPTKKEPSATEKYLSHSSVEGGKEFVWWPSRAADRDDVPYCARSQKPPWATAARQRGNVVCGCRRVHGTDAGQCNADVQKAACVRSLDCVCGLNDDDFDLPEGASLRAALDQLITADSDGLTSTQKLARQKWWVARCECPVGTLRLPVAVEDADPGDADGDKSKGDKARGKKRAASAAK